MSELVQYRLFSCRPDNSKSSPSRQQLPPGFPQAVTVIFITIGQMSVFFMDWLLSAQETGHKQ